MIRNIRKAIRIYRFNPDSMSKPRYDTFKINRSECGPMVLDALIKIKKFLKMHQDYLTFCLKKVITDI